MLMTPETPDSTVAVRRPFDSIPAALRHWAHRTPGRTALVCGDEALSYTELSDRVDAVAAELGRRGVKAGDRVMLVGHNSIGWVVAYLAVLRTGALVAPANNRLSPEQFRDQAALLDARLIIHDHDHSDLVAIARAEGRALQALARLQDAPDLAKSAPLPTIDPSAPALISFTSGTTGQPKGAVLSHAALLHGSAAFADYLGTNREVSTLILVPLFHNTGFVDQLGHMLVAGGQTNLLPRFRTADAVAEIRRRPVTFITAVPSIIRLLMVADGISEAFQQAHVVLFGGSPMPAAWTGELRTRWPHLRLVHGYGLTEFTSACSFLPPELIASVGESVGRSAPGVSLRVVDELGNDALEGTVGEVWAAGRTRMTEYWREPALTAAKMSGQWLRTGDLGYFDADGLLWLTGRLDDVIIRGGEKVLPAFVESCLAEIPEISDAAVFGVDDPVLQKRIAAAVELRPRHRFDQEAARTYLASRLPDYAIPEFWFVYKSLPRTASGKVDRRAAARHASASNNQETQ
jgi:acyl-CoA synthetase (AMP-forming)/AMP-acid ligase II